MFSYEIEFTFKSYLVIYTDFNFNLNLNRHFTMKLAAPKDMSLIEFLHLYLSGVIHESFWTFTLPEFTFESPLICGYFYKLGNSFMQTNTSSLCVQRFKNCHLTKFSLDMPSFLMCKMISLFCWMLYRDGLKCHGGTSIHPHVQHSPMASSPFPGPRKKTCHYEP